MKAKPILFLLASALLLPSLASAELEKKDARRFARFDADGNGQITQAEFLAQRERTYRVRMEKAGKAAAAIDEELEKKAENWIRQFKKHLDANEDGWLNETEFMSNLERVGKD